MRLTAVEYDELFDASRFHESVIVSLEYVLVVVEYDAIIVYAEEPRFSAHLHEPSFRGEAYVAEYAGCAVLAHIYLDTFGEGEETYVYAAIEFSVYDAWIVDAIAVIEFVDDDEAE